MQVATAAELSLLAAEEAFAAIGLEIVGIIIVIAAIVCLFLWIFGVFD